MQPQPSDAAVAADASEPPPEPVPSFRPTPCIPVVDPGRYTEQPCGELTFMLTVPASCALRRCGLIVDLHGGTMTGQMEADNTEIDRIGAERGYVVLHPSAPGGLWQDTHDLTVLNLVFETVTAFHIDPKRVHVTGFSQGGYMTWRIICRYSNLFASAAPAAAAANGAILLPEVGCEFGSNDPTDDQVDILFMFGSRDALVLPQTAITQSDAVIAHYGLSYSTRLVNDPSVRWDRYTAPSGMTFEFIHHDYITNGAIFLPLQGHCYPGSGDQMFGCEPPNEFHW
jgi:pimeloyl-ACP methyl ester carboxylesterase